jgi:hypothetical protein
MFGGTIRELFKPRSTDAFFKEPRTFDKRFPNGMPIGPRTLRRQKENRQLNKLPDSVKKVCELKIPRVCIGNRMLTWAHSRKSRFLVSIKDWQTAVRSCLACHQHIEALPHKEMRRIVETAIAARRLDT